MRCVGEVRTLYVFWWLDAVDEADVISVDENHCSPSSVPIWVFRALAADHMMVGGELTFTDRGAFIGDPCFREASYLWFGVCQLLSSDWVRDLWLWLRFARGYGWLWC